MVKGRSAVRVVADQLDQRLVQLRQFGRFEIVRHLPARRAGDVDAVRGGDPARGGKAQQRFQQRQRMAARAFGGDPVEPAADAWRVDMRDRGRAELAGQMEVEAVGILPDRGRPLVRGALQLRVSGLAIGGPYVGQRDAVRLLALADRRARIVAPAGCGKRRDGKVARAGCVRRPFERRHANGAEIEPQLLAVVARLDDVGAGGGGTADSKSLHLAAPFEGLAVLW